MALVAPPLLMRSSAADGAMHTRWAQRIAGRFRSDLWLGDFETLAVLATLALEFVFAYPAVIARLLLVGVLTLRARAASVPAILLCQLYASDFQLADMQSYEYLLDRYEASRVSIFGLPLTTNYVFAACLTISVVTRFASRPDMFRGIVPGFLIVLWCSCFPIAVIAALVSFVDKTVSWSAPVRDAMMAGCFFYGIVLADDSAVIRRVITHRLMPMFTAMLVLALLGYFYARGMYWITAAGPAVLITSLCVRRAGVSRWFAIGYFSLTMAYAFAWYPTAFGHQVAKALYSDTATTFALNGMWLGAAAVTPVAIFFLRRSQMLSRRVAPRAIPPLRTLSAVSAAVIMVLFPIAVAFASYRVTVEFSSKKFTADLPWQERIVFKLLFDRAPIYRGAIDEVLRPPFFFKVGQRESYTMTLSGDKQPWPAGSHNLILEELRRNGWYSGAVCLAIIISSMMWACTALFRTRDPMLAWYSAATFVTLIISGMTSHVAMETNASVWMLAPAGICAVLYRSESAA